MTLTTETAVAQLDPLHSLLDRFRVLSDNGRVDFTDLDVAEIEELFQLVDLVEGR